MQKSVLWQHNLWQHKGVSGGGDGEELQTGPFPIFRFSRPLRKLRSSLQPCPCSCSGPNTGVYGLLSKPSRKVPRDGPSCTPHLCYETRKARRGSGSPRLTRAVTAAQDQSPDSPNPLPCHSSLGVGCGVGMETGPLMTC